MRPTAAEPILLLSKMLVVGEDGGERWRFRHNPGKSGRRGAPAFLRATFPGLGPDNVERSLHAAGCVLRFR
jgi:hypothetical protein